MDEKRTTGLAPALLNGRFHRRHFLQQGACALGAAALGSRLGMGGV